ncbi:MAG TPA: serine hydrolase domain-containing protein, partial [Nannocystaceae bacterium]|nr:serine hydrolase domain-containing protein [Nannocystaceae bacterium]
GSPAPADRIEEQVDRAAHEGFSGSVAILRDGAPLWSGGVGLADRERGIANTPTTAFDCGSIMKVMTAAAIFRLEQDGMLSRASTLAELFDDVPPDKAEITIDQILTHRAGFAEFHDTEGDFEAMDRPTALARIFAQELLFAPGTAEAYSNSGYTLLAAIVEDASGLPFADYLRARLFDPAKMDDTGLYGEGRWADGQAAIGYDEGVYGCNSPGCWPAPTWALVGNGGLVSTVEDLLRWTVAVDDAVVLDAATRDAYRDVVLDTRGITIDGEPAYAYSGRNDFGFGAAVGEVPGRATYVVVAANAAAHYNDTALMAQLVQMSLGVLIELPER